MKIGPAVIMPQTSSPHPPADCRPGSLTAAQLVDTKEGSGRQHPLAVVDASKTRTRPIKPLRPPRAQTRLVPPAEVYQEPSLVLATTLDRLEDEESSPLQDLLPPHTERPPPVPQGHWTERLWPIPEDFGEKREVATLFAAPLADLMAMQRRAVWAIESQLATRLPPQTLPSRAYDFGRLRHSLVRAFARHTWTAWQPLSQAVMRLPQPLSSQTAEKLVSIFAKLDIPRADTIGPIATAGRHLYHACQREPAARSELTKLGLPHRQEVALSAVSETLSNLAPARRGRAMRLLRVGGCAMLIHAPNTFALLNKCLSRPWSRQATQPLERVLAAVLSAPVGQNKRSQLHKKLPMELWLTAGVSLFNRIDETSLWWFDSALGRLRDRLSVKKGPHLELDVLCFALGAVSRLAESEQPLRPLRSAPATTQSRDPSATSRQLATLRLWLDHAVFFMVPGIDALQAAEILRLVARLHGASPPSSSSHWVPLSEPLVQMYEHMVPKNLAIPQRSHQSQLFIEKLAALDDLSYELREPQLWRWLSEQKAAES